MAADLHNAALDVIEEADHQLDSPEYLTDDFRVNCFKVVPCSKRCNHDWTTCPFAHPGEKARRRDPTKCKYAAIACIDMKNSGVCPRGEDCPYAHNVFEYWMHPTRYRTQICNDGTKCNRKICFFAHKTEELRVPPHKPGFPPDWHKGKKHSRSKSTGFAAPKNTESLKGSIKSQRTNSSPMEAALPKPVEHRDLFKSNSFPSGQFSKQSAYTQRSAVDAAFKVSQYYPHLRFSETWDMERPLTATNSLPEPPMYQISSPLTSPWQNLPLDHRRSMDSVHMEPPIPENASVLGPCQTPGGDQDIGYYLQYLQCARDHMPSSALHSSMNVATLAGNLAEAEEASQPRAGGTMSFESPMHIGECPGTRQSAMPFAMPQDSIGEVVDGMKCPPWPCNFPVYNPMEDPTELISQMGLLSMAGGIAGHPPVSDNALYTTGFESNEGSSGVPMAY